MSTGQNTPRAEEKAIVTIVNNSPLAPAKKKKQGKGSVTLDEVIVIPYCDLRTLSPEELRKYGELCTRKVAQEKLRQESKSKEILENVRDILQQVIPEIHVDEDTPIMDQLATLAEGINAPVSMLTKEFKSGQSQRYKIN